MTQPRPAHWLRSSVTPGTRPAHQALLRHFASTGRAPGEAELASALGADPASVKQLLWQLSKAGAIHLEPASREITVAYPFSSTPTPHRLTLNSGVTAYGMCAVDSLGVAAMLGGPAQIDSTCAHCGAPIRIRAEGEAVKAEPGITVWYEPSGQCSSISFFCTADHARAWHAGHPDTEGEVWSLEQAAARSRGVFGDLLERRLMLLISASSYRAGAFLQAARRLGIEVVRAEDAPGPMAGVWGGDGGSGRAAPKLAVDFHDLKQATRIIVDFARAHPVEAVLPIDDSGTLLAAQASAALGLPYNSVEATWAAQDKHRMRQLLSAAGVPSPEFTLYRLSDDLEHIGGELHYPCVVKPLYLTGSRGVIRADNASEFHAAVERLKRILQQAGSGEFLVEQFIPGFEVALEGILTYGALKVLALFDKPDPLDGPYFEETIYTTPSRLPEAVQAAIAETTARAASALGLREGPIHAELRVNASGPWMVEVAGRSIGGLCSRTLRFGEAISEEELILRQAFGMEIGSFDREAQASGVMMIPIPAGGIFAGIKGCEEAESVPGIESVEITAKLNYPIQPLPEGDSYLGFIFARGSTPDRVETALREAHGRLKIEIVPEIPVLR